MSVFVNVYSDSLATLSLFTVESANNTSVLAEAATALKEDDVLSLSVSGPVKDPVPLTIAYVSGLDGHYTTVVTASPSNSALLHFNKQAADGQLLEGVIGAPRVRLLRSDKGHVLGDR